ncbi:hypothetical protein ABGV40_12235 [Paenibacillus amylolyticus]|uniref:toxin-antitoxin system YwqK family antitoxin n=1 Tax=Paenibacillus amylolyticus TaxID=1451 RepID=UPI003241DF5B
MIDVNILRMEDVLLTGIEFNDDVCFSGNSGQEVFDKPIEDGGKPISGLLYERYDNGNLAYYSYYKNGLADGDYVNYYESGRISSFQKMSKGVITGEFISWFENGNHKSIANYKYGFAITYREWDIEGVLINEKLEASEFEKKMIEKYDARAK